MPLFAASPAHAARHAHAGSRLVAPVKHLVPPLTAEDETSASQGMTSALPIKPAQLFSNKKMTTKRTIWLAMRTFSRYYGTIVSLCWTMWLEHARKRLFGSSAFCLGQRRYLRDGSAQAARHAEEFSRTPASTHAHGRVFGPGRYWSPLPSWLCRSGCCKSGQGTQFSSKRR